MTLHELLFKKGYLSDLRQNKCRCPFHDDHTPSADLEANTLRCWSKCNRTFALMDFHARFGPDALGLTLAPERPQYEEDVPDKVVMFYW